MLDLIQAFLYLLYLFSYVYSICLMLFIQGVPEKQERQVARTGEARANFLALIMII